VTILDRLIAAISPNYRKYRAAYDAAIPSRLRKFSTDYRSGESLARLQGKALRQQARELDRNHDLARGALTVLTNNVVGASGIGIEPQPRSVSGEIDEELSEQLLELWRDWCMYPEVTYNHNWVGTQRLMCRSWLRDGEALAQILEGNVALLDHRTKVPLSLEMLEADMLPTEYDNINMRNGVGGMLRNQWGQTVSYSIYKVHPGDTFNALSTSNLKTIPADKMLHLRRIDRIGQVRGISDMASVITRMEDLKDFEESERIAAKIAASSSASITKGSPDLYSTTNDETGTPIPRNMRFQPGMIFDDLMPGEKIEMIDTNRPNSGLAAHRDGQMRAIAAGLGVSYSSISRNYNGTWSAQRQELVEQYVHYQALSESFVSQFVRPVWNRFVALAVSANLVRVGSDIRPDTLDDALFIGQSMPWIDPQKEADANQVLEQNVYKSGPEIIRARGGNPKDVLDQEAKWRRQMLAAGLTPKVAAQSTAPMQEEGAP